MKDLTPRRIARLPRQMFLAGLIDDPTDKRAIKSKTPTFYRRYRHHSRFPQPIDLPDGGLAVWEDEYVAFLESFGRCEHPRDNVAPLPGHYARDKRRGNSTPVDTPTPPQAA
jgi:hypothetical protein